MKLAIPSEGLTLASEICISFGRTEQFILVDTDSMEFSVIANTAASAQGGAGIKAAQAIVDNGAKAVATLHCGQNAADVLKGAGVTVYRAVKGTVKENAEMFARNELGELTEIHPGYHGSH